MGESNPHHPFHEHGIHGVPSKAWVNLFDVYQDIMSPCSHVHIITLWGGRYDTPQHGLVNIMIRFFEVMMEKKGGTSRYATVAVVIHLSSSSQASHVGN